MLGGREKRGILIALVLFILFFASSISSYAFGVSTPYIENDTLELYPGEEYNYSFNIQNSEDQEYFVVINYNSTDNIAFMPNTQGYIPPKSYNSSFSIFLKIPKDASEGQNYSIVYSVKPKINESGAVIMGIELQRNFKVKVKSQPLEVSNTEINNESSLIKKLFKEYNEYLKLSLNVLIIIFALIIASALVWKTSSRVVSKLKSKRRSYTINEAANIGEIIYLLKKMKNEEFELSDIKDMLREKISKFGLEITGRAVHEMNRKEFIHILRKFEKNKKLVN